MPTQVYQRQDALNTLYDNMTTPLTANGNSAAIDWDVADGLPDSEIAFRIRDLEGTGTITFFLQQGTAGTYTDTGASYAVPAGGNGDYVWQIDNRMVIGNQVRLRHVISAGTDGDGVLVHAHLRPMSHKTL